MSAHELSDLNLGETLHSILERGSAIVYRSPQYWDLGIEYISPNVEKILGWFPSDFIDDPYLRQNLIHPDDVKQVTKHIRDLVNSGQQKLEYRIRKKDGTYIWVLDDVRCLMDFNGGIEAIVGYLTDITDHKATERSLRESELRHRTIFETVLEGIITIDSKGIMQDANKAAENIFGYSLDEMRGQNVSMLMPQSFARDHDSHLERYIETRKAHVVGIGRHVRGLRKNGEEFELNLMVSELSLPQGTFFVGCVRDVSVQAKAQRELAISQERLKKSQEFANLGTWEWRIEDDSIYWTQQVASILGYGGDKGPLTREEYINRVCDEDKDYVKEAIRSCLREGTKYNVKYRIILPEDDVRWVHEYGDVERDDTGKAYRMLGVIQDITNVKRREEELKQARNIAEGANRAKSEFLSRMSHELRTPLNAILGFAQLMRLSRKHPLADRQTQQVDQIVHAGNHLLDLINEVLDLAQIEAGKINLAPETFEVSELIDDCVSMCEQMAKEKNITFHVSEDLSFQLHLDRTRMKQVLLNLLSNAVKYNKEGGLVNLDVSAEKQGFLRFQITDTGHGISEDVFDQMFKPFSRLGAEQGDVEGTGIGLTLTKQIIETMGGEISFESKMGIGTTFCVDVPLPLSEGL